MTAPITSRCCAATARLTPSTSISHGTDHSPCTAMNAPMPKPPSGAIHQNRALPKTRRTPAHCAPKPCAVAAFGVSGMRHPIQTATSSVAAASTTKTVRQVTKRQRELERGGRHQRAGAARGHDPAGERGLPLRRVPGGDRLHRRHQADRDPQPDQRAGAEQRPPRFRRRRTPARPPRRSPAAPARRGAVRSGRAACRRESASRRRQGSTRSVSRPSAPGDSASSRVSSGEITALTVR